MFLWNHIAQDLAERLSVVTRIFEHALIIGPIARWQADILPPNVRYTLATLREDRTGEDRVIVLDEAADEQVTVAMGSTRFDPDALPFDVVGLTSHRIGQDDTWGLPLELPALDTPTVWLSTVAISNPHVVQVVDDVDLAPVGIVGPALESHPRFQNRVNVGFMQVVDRHAIRLRVYERGVGETLACGSGACAAVVAGQALGWLDAEVVVQARGGTLEISWSGDASSVRMTGAATTVFHGETELPDIT